MTSLRNLATPIGAVAALLLFYMVNPWVEPPDGIVDQVVTVTFWVLAIALILVLFQDRKDPGSQAVESEGPAFSRYLFSNSRAGLLWLPIRLFVGFAWLESGWGKLTNPEWTNGGAALRGYWERAAAIPEQGRPPITYEWYRDFINVLLNGNHETWFSWLVMIGEIAIGVALIAGVLTGVAAFFGAFMNMSFLLAGSASTNPVMFTLAIGLILAWKVAGYYGVDRYLLPMLGTPWRPGTLAARQPPRAPTT
ncbi:MAG: DoxX family protein [Candidatus Limnocylindrales bacterium]